MPRDNEEGRKKGLLEVTATSRMTFSKSLLPRELGVHRWMIEAMGAIIFQVPFTFDILGLSESRRGFQQCGEGGGATLGAHGDITAVCPSPASLPRLYRQYAVFPPRPSWHFSPGCGQGWRGHLDGPQKPTVNLNPAWPLLPRGVPDLSKEPPP